MININCFQKSHRYRPRVENWNDRFVSNSSAEQNFDIFYSKTIKQKKKEKKKKRWFFYINLLMSQKNVWKAPQ